MKHIGALTEQPSKTKSTQAGKGSTALTLTEEKIKNLWARMSSVYGYRWKSAYGPKDDGTWLHALQGLTPEQLSRGVKRAIKKFQTWPPTLPEFRALCESAEDLGIPSVSDAYRLAMLEIAKFQPQWSNAVVYAMACEFGVRRLSEIPQAQAWSEWQEVYARISQRVVSGEKFELPKGQQQAHSKPPSKEVVDSSLATVRAMLGGVRRAS